MAPALLVDVGLEAVRHPRWRAFGGRVTGRAGHFGAATIAAVLAFPWPSGMVLTNPAGVRAEDALHRITPDESGSESPATWPGERKYACGMKVKP
jgi:hypothetical protein